MSIVKVRFPYAANGYTIEYLNVGDERDFGATTQSLLDAGLIEPDAPEVVAPKIIAQIEPIKKKKTR